MSLDLSSSLYQNDLMTKSYNWFKDNITVVLDASWGEMIKVMADVGFKIDGLSDRKAVFTAVLSALLVALALKVAYRWIQTSAGI
jgi:hypothetical protein